MNENEKKLFLKKLVRSEKAVDELMIYIQNKFIPKKEVPDSNNHAFIRCWESYHQESLKIGSFNLLKKYLVQLQFPVKKGISKTEDYKNVTLKGKQKQSSCFLELYQPNDIALELYESSIADKIPVVTVPNHKDFNTIVCALGNKNEPMVLPNSMGALFINGINNWNRIHQLKLDWLQENSSESWALAFKKQILPNPYLFKDKLIILSTKGYSGIESENLGISKEEWKSLSLIIRKEHECAHLFTLQYYGYMANNIHDEIVADYAGITKALGQFNKDWFLRFMGLENYPKYREGGRLQNYQAPIQLTKEALDGLKVLVKKISETISSFDTILGSLTTSEDYLNRIKSICETDMITMASGVGLEKLLRNYDSKKAITTL